VAAPDPPLLRLVDIARLLNVTKERARQIADGARYEFPAPVVASNTASPPRWRRTRGAATGTARTSGAG